jgi:hypothetical protein
MKITEKIFDVETKTETIKERDMTTEELAAYQLGLQEQESLLRIREEREAARQAVLTKLGITEEEAKLLLS